MQFKIAEKDLQWEVYVDTPEGAWVYLATCKYLATAGTLVRALEEESREWATSIPE